MKHTAKLDPSYSLAVALLLVAFGVAAPVRATVTDETLVFKAEQAQARWAKRQTAALAQGVSFDTAPAQKPVVVTNTPPTQAATAAKGKPTTNQVKTAVEQPQPQQSGR